MFHLWPVVFLSAEVLKNHRSHAKALRRQVERAVFLCVRLARWTERSLPEESLGETCLLFLFLCFLLFAHLIPFFLGLFLFGTALSELDVLLNLFVG